MSNATSFSENLLRSMISIGIVHHVIRFLCDMSQYFLAAEVRQDVGAGLRVSARLGKRLSIRMRVSARVSA